MFRIKDIMTTEVFTLHSTQNLALVRFLMQLKHVRHIPIVEPDNRFVGLLTHRDLLAQTISHLADPDGNEQQEIDQSIPIREIMKTNVVTVGPDQEVIGAIQILLDNKYGCLPVVDNNKLVGIVTEADFLQLTRNLLTKQATET